VRTFIHYFAKSGEVVSLVDPLHSNLLLCAWHGFNDGRTEAHAFATVFCCYRRSIIPEGLPVLASTFFQGHLMSALTI
jgi:hypothetical protein